MLSINIDSILIKKIKLKKKIEEFRKKNFDTLEIHQSLEILNKANKSMFQWMGQYEPNIKLKNDSLTQLYFEDLLKKIKKVHDDIAKSLSIRP